jgi:DNA invertase Pin-like site-specific DNA recombinase
MSESLKVQPQHLERGAYLYVRQSSMRQVIENVESTKRQYALRSRAIALGWHEGEIIVVDSDQGESGASAAWREGFQQLVADVSMGRAGIVMGLEVSRLARNNADWHRLLEICALADTLILDEDGVYDPTNFNDRLLLGLKGTMSEAELHVLKARLRGGILNKVRRGEYRCPLPTGFVYDDVGNVALDPDAQSRDTIVHFSRRFACRLGMPNREDLSEGGSRISVQAHWRRHGVPAADRFDRYARLDKPPIRRRVRVRPSPVSASCRRPEEDPAKARLW